MYLKISKIELVPDQYGQHIKISRIGLYDNNGKWIRWVKLNEATVKLLAQNTLPVTV